MHRQGHITVGALHHLAAAAAAEETAVAASGHQHHRLVTALRQPGQAIHQGTTNQAFVPVRQLEAHVDHMHRRQLLLGNALGQARQGKGPCG